LVHRFHCYDSIHILIQYYSPGLQCKKVSIDSNDTWTTLSQVYPNPVFTIPSQVQYLCHASCTTPSHAQQKVCTQCKMFVSACTLLTGDKCDICAVMCCLEPQLQMPTLLDVGRRTTTVQSVSSHKAAKSSETS